MNVEVNEKNSATRNGIVPYLLFVSISRLHVRVHVRALNSR